MSLLFWLNLLSLSLHLHHSAPHAQAWQHLVSWICQEAVLQSHTHTTPTFDMPFPPANLHLVQSSFPCSHEPLQIKQASSSLEASPLRLPRHFFFLPICSSNIIPLSWVSRGESTSCWKKATSCQLNNQTFTHQMPKSERKWQLGVYF